MRAYLWTIGTFTLAVVVSCSPEEFGYPRIASASQSPNLRYTVEIRNHLTIDPPEQALWVGETGRRLRYVAGVASDSIWNGPVAWSPDSSLFAFIVADELVVVEPANGSIRLRQWLIPRTEVVNRSQNEIRYIEFAGDPSAVIAQVCTRRQRTCSEPTSIHVPRVGTGV